MAIENVILYSDLDRHENEDRIIVGSRDKSSINWDRLRIVKVKRACYLGGHWREYPEQYAIIGEALFFLEDIHTNERRQYSLKSGQSLFVPPEVALKIRAFEGTIITVCFPNADLEKQSHKYEFKV